MQIVVLTESWPTDGDAPMPAPQTADAVAAAWGASAPHASVQCFAIGDGGVRSGDSLAGRRVQVGGAEAIGAGRSVVLAPTGGEKRWEPHALATALLGLAAEHAGSQPARTVIVPVGDASPAGDATDLWLGGIAQMRAGVASLDVVVAVASQRPLLGFHGMSAALRDGREVDEAISLAAQAQEDRWAAIARDADAIASVPSLLGSSRLSDLPGTGAAGGLAYALGAIGARIVPGAPLMATLTGADEAAATADLVVAVVPGLEPRSLDDGAVPAAASLAARRGLPAIVIAPESRIGRRDLMNAGLAAAHEGGRGVDGLTAAVRRVAQTWTPRR
ncbi:glycerate kinase [Demequina muriae]|uniref:Glycerate kinase n=1 Tax=Demequina muriae TaxID=3051664 RepID=A0ABT8GJD7_9MICO|nr:glycerate kinase [Demequina sp. EGI L300058]MDN4481547.1 glycerate kinase [Demequina sp. EGI L300058]